MNMNTDKLRWDNKEIFIENEYVTSINMLKRGWVVIPCNERLPVIAATDIDNLVSIYYI